MSITNAINHIENLKKYIMELERISKEPDSPQRREKLEQLRWEIMMEIQAIIDEVNLVVV